MTKLNKGTIQSWFLIVIVVLVIAGGIFAWQSLKAPKEMKAPAIGEQEEEEVIPPVAGEQEEEKVLEEVSPSIPEKHIGFIKAIYTKDEKEYLGIDYIQYLTGDEAIKAIKEDGKCPVDIYPDPGFCIPNGFYIRNQNPQIRTFEISRDVKINRVFPSAKTNYGDFKNDFKSGDSWIPFYITLVDSVVKEITEQYIP